MIIVQHLLMDTVFVTQPWISTDLTAAFLMTLKLLEQIISSS